ALVFQTTCPLVYYAILVYFSHATSVVSRAAVACTGIIWSRYSMVITPKNWNLFSVNVAMAGTGLYQLSRKIRKDYFEDEKEVAASLEG
uniref:Mitochondrial pyruvate carrier n=2 Tax=Triticinae TaxID=1648030 RepID=A0A453BB73_AEGTS